MENFYYVWGVSRQAVSYMKKQKICKALANDLSDVQAIMSIKPQENTDALKVQENNVIGSYEDTDSVFTTKYLYCTAKMRKYREECGECAQADLIAQRKTFGELFENESDIVKKHWEAQRREHLKIQSTGASNASYQFAAYIHSSKFNRPP